MWFQEKMESCDNRPSLSADEKKRIHEKLSDAEFRAQLAQRATSGAYGGGVLPSKDVPKIGTLGERARSLLASMLKIKSLGRSALDFNEFNAYWEKRGK